MIWLSFIGLFIGIAIGLKGIYELDDYNENNAWEICIPLSFAIIVCSLCGIYSVLEKMGQ